MGLIPGQRTTIPQAMEQWSPSTTTRKPVCHKHKMLHDTTKTPHAATKTQGSQINKYFKKEDTCTPVFTMLLSPIQRFAISWTAALQASLSFTISRSLLKLMSIESVMPSNHLIAASFTKDKTWTQPKCPSTDEWIKKICCVYTHTHTQWNIIQLLKIKFCHLQQHGWIWRVFIMLSKISQRKTNTVCFHVHVESLKKRMTITYKYSLIL